MARQRDERRLAGRVAIVTGAGSGNGRAISLACASEGARVLAADVREGAAIETAEQILSAGGDCHAMACDVSQRSAVEAMIATWPRLATIWGIPALTVR